VTSKVLSAALCGVLSDLPSPMPPTRESKHRMRNGGLASQISFLVAYFGEAEQGFRLKPNKVFAE